MSEIIQVSVVPPLQVVLSGNVGFSGIQGEKGDQGDQGIQGIQGEKGDKGDKGDQGDTGAGLSAYEVAVLNGFVGTESAWLLSLKGDQGEQGIQGVQGIQGIQGIQGVQGITGEKGDKGDQGIQGIQGEKGDKGDKGDQGDQGIQGIQGIQGNQGIAVYNYVGISSDQTLTTGGLFYTSGLTSDITVTLDFPVGHTIELLRFDAAYNTCFTGITSIDGVAVEPNKGVFVSLDPIVNRTIGSLKLICTAPGGVFTTVEGNYLVTWVPGFIPPFTTFTFTGDATGDMANWLGTDGGLQSWVNPATSGAITVTQSSAIDGNRTGVKIFDKSLDGTTGVWHSAQAQAGEWVQFHFNNNRDARINRIYLRMSGHQLMGFDFQIYLANTWVTLVYIPSSGSSNVIYDTGLFTNNDFSADYRLLCTGAWTYPVIGDIAIYGDLMNA